MVYSIYCHLLFIKVSHFISIVTDGEFGCSKSYYILKILPTFSLLVSID